MSNALMRVRGAKIHVVISKIKLRTGRNFGKTLLSGAIRTIQSVLCWNTHKQVQLSTIPIGSDTAATRQPLHLD